MYNPSFFWFSLKLIFPLSTLIDYIMKIIKLPYCIPKAGKYLFAVYHPHYKEEFWKTNTTYNSYPHYGSDKLKIIAFMYQPKAFFILFYAI